MGRPAANGADLGVGTGKQLSDNALTPDPTPPVFPLFQRKHHTLNSGDYWAVNTLRPLNGPDGGYAVPATAPYYELSRKASRAETTILNARHARLEAPNTFSAAVDIRAGFHGRR